MASSGIELIWKRVLVFGAHPDDEIIGPGGTIKRLSGAGSTVTVVTFCQGETGYSENDQRETIAGSRATESGASDLVLGVDHHINLGAPTQGVVNDRVLYQRCVELIRRYRPDLILTHYREDKHRDHRAVSEITDEARWKASENLLPELGEPWFAPDLMYYEIFDLFTHPSVLVDISGTLPDKVRAMSLHESQLPILPSVIQYITSLAKVRARPPDCECAEAFVRSTFAPSVY